MLFCLLVEPRQGSGKGVGALLTPGCHPGLLIFHPFGVVGCIRILNSKMQRQAEGGLPPLHVKGGQALVGIDYDLPVASAQVKSALLLAGVAGLRGED